MVLGITGSSSVKAFPGLPIVHIPFHLWARSFSPFWSNNLGLLLNKFIFFASMSELSILDIYYANLFCKLTRPSPLCFYTRKLPPKHKKMLTNKLQFKVRTKCISMPWSLGSCWLLKDFQHAISTMGNRITSWTLEHFLLLAKLSLLTMPYPPY